MLKFYYGTELERLADRLLEELDENPSQNLLKPETFVVQNHGIGQWLSLYVAEQEGIAANLEFKFPSEILWQLIRQVDAGIPENLPSDRRPMTWSLMQLFQDEGFLSDFENLRYYVRDEDPKQQAVRSWKLSSKIADVFDQYLIYRPEMILGWEQRKLKSSHSETEQWQMRLWNRLLKYWKEGYDGEWLHRAELQEELLKAIEKDNLDHSKLPQRLSIFGVSSMPPIIIQTLVKLSGFVDVCFYQLLVDPEVQDREDFVNPMLQSLGKEEAEFTSLFSAYNGNEEKKVVDDSEETVQSVFNVIQSDLKNNSVPKGRNLNIPSLDNSIQVHSCHSPMREVEVLYDQLLALFEENPKLNPDDILIMTPDIETYAPMIEAVFESPDEGQPEMPYSIADRGLEGANSAIDTFLKILELCESRFKVTDVLDLLDANPIQEAFGFTDDDLNQLERWIRDNRVRWGIDGQFKEKLQVPESDSFTWKSGLNRMILGYVMKPDEDHLFDGIFPYDEIESSDDAALAGKFSHFLEELFALHRFVKSERKPRAWAEKLMHVPDTFLPDNRDYFRQVSAVYQAIDQFSEFSSLGGFDREVSFTIVRSWMKEQLEKSSTGGGRIGRGVTFSSLMPLRSIPFKVIGMIGMNEGAFPRSKIPIEFDLLHLDPQPGDPIQSDEERNLFLENLLSARECVYFSYVGQSNRQDTDFPPSVVLKEFVDYLEEHYGLSSGNLVTEHRLQAFSPSYFKDEELFSYSQTQQEISSQLVNEKAGEFPFMKENLPEPEDEWKQLSINELVSFFQHPAKFLLQNRLGIYLGRDEVLTDEREPFSLYGLDKYKVGQELLERHLRDKSLESYEQNLRARDMLPEGWRGDSDFQQRAREVREFVWHLDEKLDDEPIDHLEVDLSIGNFRIVGKLSDMYKNARMTFRFGSMRPKDVIDLWIKHLCLQEVKPDSHQGRSRLFTRHSKQEFAEYRLESTDKHIAILEQLLDTYWTGLQQCCYFFPESSFAYAEEVCFKNGRPESGLNKAGRNWIREYGSYPGESEDPYNKLLLGSENPLNNKLFENAARQFWGPFFDAIIQKEG